MRKVVCVVLAKERAFSRSIFSVCKNLLSDTDIENSLTKIIIDIWNLN